MKKFISVIAALMVLTASSAIAPLSASADSVVAFEIGTVSTTGNVSDGKLVQEETVTIPVRITENVGMTTFLLEFTQDSNIEIISLDSKKDDTEFHSGSFTKNIDALRVLWIDNSCSDVDLCGLLMNIQVKVPAGTPVGKYEIGFNESETQLTNVNFDSLEYTLTSGYVEVVEGSSSNPSSPQTPVTTQAPQPIVTQTPATTKAPEPAVTQAPVATKASEASTVKQHAAEPITTNATVTELSASETTLEKSAEVTDNTVLTSSSVDSTDISSESSETSDVTSNTFNTSAKPSNNNNNANGNKNNTVTKTDKSPSTGANGVVIPAILLAASSVGVVIASSKKKKK